MDNILKLQKAKSQLILEQPFFATLALQMSYVADETVKTATTNGKQIAYNPAYVASIDIELLKTILAHEVMHVALLHHLRRNNRDFKRWNMACDYAINPLLQSAGFHLPAAALCSDFKDLPAEKIYDLLQQSSTGNGDPTQTLPEMGEVEDLPAHLSIQQEEAQVKQQLVQATMIAKRYAQLPGHLDRLVKEALKPRIDWKEALTRFLTELQKNDYCWRKPSPRYLHSGLYLPVLENDEPGELILIADTSVSICEQLLNQFGSEVQEITNSLNISLKIIYVDTVVQHYEIINKEEPLQLHPKGGGGTNFKPGFKFIEQEDWMPKAVVYLTDGECDKFPGPPDYPVLWAQFGNSTFDPPFGEVVQVD